MLAVFDVNNPPPPDPLQNWAAPAYHNPSWTNSAFGQVGGKPGDTDEIFGLALDDATPPNIYVTSTSGFRTFPGNPAGTGKVYKVDGATGAVSLFAKLPNCTSHPSCPSFGNPGLGNIAFDRAHHQFFVTNFFDGRIYRLDMSGTVQGLYDPFGDYTGTSGFVSLSERIWGIGVYQGRVYFGTWSEDQRGGPSDPNQVWSVPLNAAGQFVAAKDAEVLEITLQPLNSRTMPISDIEFGNDGRMLVAERSMSGDIFSGAHSSRVLEYVGTQGSWASANLYGIGVGSGTNSAGGVDHLCSRDPGGPGTVVATGDALRLDPGASIYGLQLLPDTGGTVNNSVLIDLDGNIMNDSIDKTLVGDVDAYDLCPGGCMNLVDVEILCEAGEGLTYTLRFKVHNGGTVAASQLFLVDLPSGLSAAPNSWSFTGEPGGALAPGATSGVLEAKISGGVPGLTVPFRLSLHDTSLAECCTLEQEIELPACGCAQLISGTVSCAAGGGYTYDYTVRNLTKDTIEYVLFAPTTPGLTIGQPGQAIPPVLPGGTATGQVSFSGPGLVAGQWACYSLSLHNGDLEQCCSINGCADLPYCNRPAPAPLHLSLSTGVSTAPAGSRARRDLDWRIVKGGPQAPSSAMLVERRPVWWPAPLAGSAWISVDPVRGDSQYDVKEVEFERCFCLSRRAREVSLDLSILADDKARVSLNSVSLPPVGGAVRDGRPLNVLRTGAVGDGLFKIGNNCLRIQVPDRERGSVGLDLAGVITAPNGACPTP